MREHWFCLKDCLHQLVHQPTRTTTNGDNGSEERTRPFAAIFEHLQTTANLLSLPYKEGVAGSNPASPTTFFLHITVFCGRQERIGRGIRACLLQPERNQGDRNCLVQHLDGWSPYFENHLLVGPVVPFPVARQDYD